MCSRQLFGNVLMSGVLQHVGGSDHLPITVKTKQIVTAHQQVQQAALLECPPVLKWRGPEQTFSQDKVVQQSISEGALQAALALL